MLADAKSINQILGDIKEISKDVRVGVEEQAKVVEQAEQQSEAVLQDSKVAGEELKQAAKYKSSALKWSLVGTFTAVGAVLGTLIPVPGVGTAIGAGAGAALGGTIGGGIEKAQNKKVGKVEFSGVRQG